MPHTRNTTAEVFGTSRSRSARVATGQESTGEAVALLVSSAPETQDVPPQALFQTSHQRGQIQPEIQIYGSSTKG
jgi:hypothetical protein